MTEKSWKCVRLVLDRSREKGMVRIDSPTYEQLLAENIGFEDFVESIKTDVDAGLVYDDSEHEIGGIVVLYLPFGEISVDAGDAVPLCEHGKPLRCSHEDLPETLYWSGGTDCGEPGCVEHAYLRPPPGRGIDETQGGHERRTRPEGVR